MPIELGRIAARYSEMRAVWPELGWVVEGAGGLLVPLDDDGTLQVELVRQMALPLLLVARSTLGTINHTLLTLEAAVGRGLPVAGVVISHTEPALSAADASNLAALRQALGPGLVGELPHLPADAPPPAGALDLERLLEGPIG